MNGLNNNKLGFEHADISADRLINKDGRSNTVVAGLKHGEGMSMYHSLVTMPWMRFLAFIMMSFIVINVVFAFIYMFADTKHYIEMTATTFIDRFWEYLFFSAQNISAVEYNRIDSNGQIIGGLMAIQSIIGLTGFGIIAALFYGRFAQPESTLIFSKHAVIYVSDNKDRLIFRVMNKKSGKTNGEFINANARVIMAYVVSKDNKTFREFAELKIDNPHIDIMHTTWTVMHTIDENSPIANWSKEDFEHFKSEIIVFVEGHDETFSETVYARTSYLADEIVYGASFKNMVIENKNSIKIAGNCINDYVMQQM